MYRLILFLVCSIVFDDGQNSVSNIVLCDNETAVNITLDEGFYKQEQRFEEGVFTIFSYADSSHIEVFCGHMVSLPMLTGDKYIVNTELKTTCYESRKGVNLQNAKYWREDTYENGATVIYENVSKARLENFNFMLDNVKIKDISKEK